MRFGIGVKLIVLTTMLVCVTAGLLLLFTQRQSSAIVIAHEAGDLIDETKLRAWELLSEIHTLRSDVEMLAQQEESLRLASIPPPHAESAQARESLRRVCLERFWRTNYLSLEVIALDASGEDDVLVSLRRRTPIASRREFLEKLKASEVNGMPVVSPVSRLEMPSDAGGESEVVNGVWIGKHFLPLGGMASGRSLLIVGALNLDAPLPIGEMSTLARMNRSARHLAVLANEPTAGSLFDASLLVEPDPTKQGILDRRALSELFAALYRQRDELARDYARLVPRTEPRQVIESHQHEFRLERPLWFQQSKQLDASRRKAVAACLQKFAEQLPSGSGQRVGGLSAGVGSLRLLAHSRAEVLALASAVEQRLRGTEGLQDLELAWESAVRCETGIVHGVLIPVPSSDAVGGRRYLGLAQAAFREEMQADVSSELAGLTKIAIALVLAAAFIGFVVSLVFTRPLKRITQAVESVASATTGQDPANNPWRGDAAALVQSLPVSRDDEIGVLARAFRQMIDEVVKSNERLREINAELDGRVRARTRELEQANAELIAARDKAQDLSRAKDSFLASVSHELRNPLNQVSGFCQLLELTDLDEEQRGDLAKIRAASQQLLALINDILDYQKIIMGGVSLETEEIDVAGFLTELSEAMVLQAREHHNRLVVDLHEPLGKLNADAQRVRQILVNLIGNACKFTSQGTVTLRARRMAGDSGDVLRFDVSDTGRGMTPEEQDRLFTPFTKLAARQGNRTGTGLGLVICKGFCELMHGRITLTSALGQGSTFSVWLPANTKLDSILPPIPSAEPPAPSAAPGGVGGGALADQPASPHPLATAIPGSTGAPTASGGAGTSPAREPTTPGGHWGSGGGHPPAVHRAGSRGTESGPATGCGAGEGKGADAANFPTAAARPHPLPLDSARTVLVIDDDAGVREMMQRYLAGEGFHVLTAGDGVEGLRIARQARPAVITLDAIMPDPDGWNVLVSLKSDPATAPIPVVMVTIMDEEDRGYSLGAAEYVSKPVNWENLATLLARYTGNKRDRSILVVDRDSSDSERLRERLVQEGWSVLEARRGSTALELLARERPAAMILDLGTPSEAEWEALSPCCELAHWLRLPVVLISPREPAPEDLEQLSGQVLRVLRRGEYNLEELVREIHRRVDKHLRHAAREAQEEMDHVQDTAGRG